VRIRTDRCALGLAKVIWLGLWCLPGNVREFPGNGLATHIHLASVRSSGQPESNWPSLRSQLTARGREALEAADCGFFSIVNIENSQQLRHLQDLLEFLAQVAEAHRCTLSFGT
jgi:hypothetical protein